MTARRKGSIRPRTVRTDDNIDALLFLYSVIRTQTGYDEKRISRLVANLLSSNTAKCY